ITRDEQPNGWYVQQQFTLEPQADGTVALRYTGYETTESWFGANTYVTVGDGGALTLGAAKAADTAVLVVGSNPFINGREAHDRTSTALSAGQEALVKAVTKANPHTV